MSDQFLLTLTAHIFLMVSDRLSYSTIDVVCMFTCEALVVTDCVSCVVGILPSPSPLHPPPHTPLHLPPSGFFSFFLLLFSVLVFCSFLSSFLSFFLSFFLFFLSFFLSFLPSLVLCSDLFRFCCIFFLSSSSSSSETFTYIYNLCIQKNVFPTAFKRAKVIPLPKTKTISTDLNDYRPISILSVLTKPLERHIINN